ncbi:WD40-repeat-containing domain protein [Jimgerdemannia flammicorona]|uniref:WD40-repeat-containing domain protein n=1 Tax=Jimgerdemannia flammicorona TaxID=994334 RepID=A0A433D3E8_9FUNG|nr:WD40-repeat-containing domain protein [Jimgerdemannia flammicorona]
MERCSCPPTPCNGRSKRSNLLDYDPTPTDPTLHCIQYLSPSRSPVCLNLIKEAFITRCGHSFCYLCIVEHLEHHQNCPTCQNKLLREHIYPNFLLNKLIQKTNAQLHHQAQQEQQGSSSKALESSSSHRGTLYVDTIVNPGRLRESILRDDGKEWTVAEINSLLSTLLDKKRQLESAEKEMEFEILTDFLTRMKTEKERAWARLERELACLNEDLATAHGVMARLAQRKIGEERRHRERGQSEDIEAEREGESERLLKNGVEVPDDDAEITEERRKRKYEELETYQTSEVAAIIHSMGAAPTRFSLADSTAAPPSSSSSSSLVVSPGKARLVAKLAAKKERMNDHFKDLQECYFENRLNSSTSSAASTLDDFSTTLTRFTRHARFRVVNTLRYGDIFTTSSIVSAIEFDRDDEYFATAGVTKKIKIFEYGNIERGGVAATSHEVRGPPSTSIRTRNGFGEVNSGQQHRHLLLAGGMGSGGFVGERKVMDSVMHYPIREMLCRNKISCLSWNSYIKSQISSSDYDGIVTVWDAHTGQAALHFDEHERRAWSVDFSRADPTRLASGSDDSRVKIWSTNHKRSCHTIESKANVCCVKFNPDSSHYFAFGSADHHVHYYDLRNPHEPVIVFKGHKKAVSYVKWLNGGEFVSASTDSTLKLWNINNEACARTYTGHSNEKNFVGLSVNGDWIACGSENNAVYAYYKALKSPVVSVKFGGVNPVTVG